ncbi:cobalt ABC transporter permease (plasmid) [Paenibacillus thiaminolyticus]|uniref:cobalt ABC transporter permease n=1 Tax=Paenibacillus thiaminolyticus TaxID=49283 RepID=UPI002330FE6E|nr:cobalt ABC transporter permease [Paenibacillus thiaminolyticus]WCF11403.1 cobalt ABC transporter permease [Paenibacillus thiaminolyticus]
MMSVLLKQRKGYISIIMIFFIATALPFLLFFFVELNHIYNMKDKFQSFADASASGAIMQLEREQVSDGKLILDKLEAERIAHELIKSNYALDEQMGVSIESPVTETPHVKVYTIGFESDGNRDETEFITEEGFVYSINNPTVIVYTESKPKGMFYSRFVNIRTISAYEIDFKRGHEAEINQTPQNSNDGIVLTMKRIVNPLSVSSVRFPLDWPFTRLPLLAGTNMEISLQSTSPNVKLDNGSYNLILQGNSYDKIVSRSMRKISDYELTDVIMIPEDVQIGTNVGLDFQDGIRVLSPNGEELKGNAEVGFSDKGELIGEIESNIFDLIRIKKKYYTSVR